MIQSIRVGTDIAVRPKGASNWAPFLGLFLGAALTIGPPAYALDDVPGWQNTNWSMTEAEVKAAMGSLGLPLGPLPAAYVRSFSGRAPFKTDVEIAGNYYDAIFMFPDDTRRLGKVLVSTLDYSRDHALTLRDSLLNALTEKYGRPGEPESLGSMAALTRWTFKTTTVVLSLYTDTAAAGHHVTQVAITYAPTLAASESPRDKLLGLALLRALGEVSRSAR